jgi:hypothetical protein
MEFVIAVKDGKPNGLPIAAENLRQVFEDFPLELTKDALDKIGYVRWSPAPTPVLTVFEDYLEDEPYLDENGVYHQIFKVFEISEERKKQILENNAKEIRQIRDRLLQESDWSQGDDIPKELKQRYTSYRQKLRDLPSGDGFPLKVQWPTLESE